jgi:hypothetical protein
LLLDLRTNSTSRFQVTKAGSIGGQNSSTALFNLAETNSAFGFSSGSPGIYKLGTLIGLFQSAGPSFAGELGVGNTSRDLLLARDDVGVLAQRRTTVGGTTYPQAFRIYNAYTDASNYERGFMRWNSNVFEIGGEVLGSGTARTLKVMNSTTIQITPSNAVLQIDANVRPTSNGSNNLGIDSVRWATTFTANVVQSGYQELAEMTAPAAPAADRVRIYAQDNGSGKTQLMALFATGAAVEIAIEP